MSLDEKLLKHRPQALEFGLDIYTGTPEQNLMFLRWYFALAESGELGFVVRPDRQAVLPFLEMFQDALTVFTADSLRRLDRVVWVRGTDKDLKGPAELGLWVSKPLRGARKTTKLLAFLHEVIFEVWPSILAYTWLPERLALFQKCGYSILAGIPRLYGKFMVFILHCNKEDYKKSRLKKVAEEAK